MSLFLAGASRGVGREIARCLRERGIPVQALLRSEATRPELESLGLKVLIGDAMDPVAMIEMMKSDPPETVISTIGGLPQDGQRADYLGNKHLIDAAVQAGSGRFILISSIGSGNSQVALSPQTLQVLGAVLAEKEKAEQHLVNSGLNYTVIRPGGLKSDPPTGNGILTLDPRVAGSINRADVAELVCRCLDSDRSQHQILSAMDRTLIYGQPDFEEFTL